MSDIFLTPSDFTLSNASRFYSSKGDPLASKGLPTEILISYKNKKKNDTNVTKPLFTQSNFVTWFTKQFPCQAAERYWKQVACVTLYK